MARYHDMACSREGLTDRDCSLCKMIDVARRDERLTIAQSIEAPEDDCVVCELDPKKLNGCPLRSLRCPLPRIAKFIRDSES